MAQKIHSPHDRFFRASFKDKKTAIKFFQAYFPKELLEAIDFSALSLDTTTFVDEKLEEYRSDLLYQVKLRSGKPAYLYLLFEHQSTPDKTMPFRILRYILKIWQHLCDKHNTKRLLPVIPLVLSQSKWTYSPYLIDMMDLDAETKNLLAPWLPDFRHMLVDLSEMNDHQIKGTVFGKIVLHLLKSSREGKFIEAFTQLKPLLQALLRQDNAMGFIETLLRYSTAVADNVSVDEVRAMIVENLNEAAGVQMMTIVDQIEKKVGAQYKHQLEASERREGVARQREELARQSEGAARQREEVARQKEGVARQNEQKALEREKLLQTQLRAAGIEPKA